MTHAKFRIMILMLLAMMIGCGGGDEDGGGENMKDSEAQSLMKRYAPRDVEGVFYINVAAARRDLPDIVPDIVRKNPQKADAFTTMPESGIWISSRYITFDQLISVLDKIDAIVGYYTRQDGVFPLLVIHGQARPGDLRGIVAQLTGESEAEEPKLVSKGNGRYTLGDWPLQMQLIDGREANDLDGNVIVVSWSQELLTKAFVGALGKGESKAVTLALDKADSSVSLWGGMVMGKTGDPWGAESLMFSGNLTGDKLVRSEVTFASEETAINLEKRMLGDDAKSSGFEYLVKFTRSGAVITFETTKSEMFLAALAMPGMSRGVEGAYRAACRGNLKIIGEGCLFYVSENRGKYPENLQVLIDKAMLRTRALKCPSDKSSRECSYLYVAPSPEAVGRTLIVCELRADHEHSRYMLFKNGDLEEMSEAKFRAELKLPRNAAFAAAMKKAGG